jgi:hypothetical protein
MGEAKRRREASKRGWSSGVREEKIATFKGLSDAQLEAGDNADQHWFHAHSGRSWRLRAMTTAERRLYPDANAALIYRPTSEGLSQRYLKLGVPIGSIRDSDQAIIAATEHAPICGLGYAHNHDPDSHADKEWFAAHPDRFFRLRPISSKEGRGKSVGRNSSTVVWRVSPVARIRVIVELARPRSEYGDDEATARALFREVYEKDPGFAAHVHAQYEKLSEATKRGRFDLFGIVGEAGG